MAGPSDGAFFFEVVWWPVCWGQAFKVARTCQNLFFLNKMIYGCKLALEISILAQSMLHVKEHTNTRELRFHSIDTKTDCRNESDV